MGRGTRDRPARLAEKLTQIRLTLGLSQNEMVRKLGMMDYTRQEISSFELGTREPPLPVILRYARVAGISTDILLDDQLEVPKKLPIIKH